MARSAKYTSRIIRSSAVLLGIVSFLHLCLGLYSTNEAILVGGGTALTHSLLVIGLSSFSDSIVIMYLRMISMITCSALVFVLSLRMLQTGFGFAEGDVMLEDASYGLAYASLVVGSSSAFIAIAVDLITLLGLNRFTTDKQGRKVPPSVADDLRERELQREFDMSVLNRNNDFQKKESAKDRALQLTTQKLDREHELRLQQMEYTQPEYLD